MMTGYKWHLSKAGRNPVRVNEGIKAPVFNADGHSVQPRRLISKCIDCIQCGGRLLAWPALTGLSILDVGTCAPTFGRGQERRSNT